MKVIFRKFNDGDIIALFPDLIERDGCIQSYMRIGQHGAASRGLVYDTKPAKLEEYSSLLAELRGIGYNLTVGKRINRVNHA